MKKRVTAMLLTLCMALGMVPVTALPASAAEPETAYEQTESLLEPAVEPEPAYGQDESLPEPAAETRAASSIQQELEDVREQVSLRGSGKPAPKLPTDFELEKNGFVLHFGMDIGNRYSYDGHDLIGKGKPATISVNSSGTNGQFNHSVELYHMAVESQMMGAGQSQQLSGSAVPSDGGTARLTVREDGSDRFRSSNIGYVPFALSVWVPAQTTKTVRFEFDGTSQRNSKGEAGYYVELFHWGDSYSDTNAVNTTFMTGDTGSPSTTSAGEVLVPNGMPSNRRAYWNTSGGGRFLTQKDVTYTNNGSQGKWVTQYFGFYTGVGRSSSLLGSYHHKLESTVKITEKVLSEQRLSAPVVRLEQDTSGNGSIEPGEIKEYHSLDEALEAFNRFDDYNTAPNRLVLLQDVTPLYGRSVLTQAGTIDLNGHTWSANTIEVKATRQLTFENGTLKSLTSDWDTFLTVERKGRLYLYSNVKVEHSNPAGTAVRVAGILDMHESASITSSGVALSLYGEGKIADTVGEGYLRPLSGKGSPTIEGDVVDIKLVNGGRIHLDQALTKKYTLTVDRRPTQTSPVFISSMDAWPGATRDDAPDPNDCFELRGIPGGQLDLMEFDMSTKKVYVPMVRTAQVTLNANGGGIPGNVTQISIDGNGRVASLPTPTLTGSRFEGWFTAATGGQKVTESTVFQGDTTLYAQWSGQQYTVTFVNNGPGRKPNPITVTYGHKYGQLPKLTDSSYQQSFQGWYTEETGGKRVTEDTLVNLEENHTLYAHWRGQAITLSFNTKASGVEAPESITRYYNEPYGELPTLYRRNYNFLGWTTFDGSDAPTVTADQLVDSWGSATLFAKWEGKKYKVTLDPAGGTLGDETSFLMIAADVRYNNYLPDNPTRPGYTFLNWVMPDGTDIGQYTTAIGAPHTITAKWEKNKYDINFQANTGNTTDNPPRVSVYSGQLVPRPAEPSKPGYEFTGWYSDQECTKPWRLYFDRVWESTTLYAGWKESAYSIVFHAGGGYFTYSPGNESYWYFAKDVKDLSAALSEAESHLSRTGHTLLGWVDSEGNKAPDVLSESMNLYAVWEGNEYQVTFDPNGGSFTEAANATKTVVFAQPYGALPNPAPPDDTKVFLGWYTAQEGGELVRSSGKMLKVEDHTLYARWEEGHYHIDQNGNKILFQEWTNSKSAPTSGNYYLTKDVVITINAADVTGKGKECWEVSQDLNLCLNGHTIKGRGDDSYQVADTVNIPVLTVMGGVTSIYDCAEAHGSIENVEQGYGPPMQPITVSREVIVVKNASTLNLYNGRVTGGIRKFEDGMSSGVAVTDTAVFNMYGGEIVDNEWIRISGGYDSDNSSGTQITVGPNATANLLGGTVGYTQGWVGANGVGVRGSLTLRDVTIQQCRCVYVAEGAKVYLGGKVVFEEYRDGKDPAYQCFLYVPSNPEATGGQVTILEDGLSAGSRVLTRLYHMGWRDIMDGTSRPIKPPKSIQFSTKGSGSEKDVDGLVCWTWSNNTNMEATDFYPIYNAEKGYLEFVYGTGPAKPFPGGTTVFPKPGEKPTLPDGGDPPVVLGHSHRPCGLKECMHEGEEMLEYTAYTGTVSGTVYLTKDQTELTVSEDANICLNGHTVETLNVTGGTLNLCNCKIGSTMSITTKLNVTGGTVNCTDVNAKDVESSGDSTVNLTGGQINGSLKVNGGVVTVDGVTFKGGNGIQHDAGKLILNSAAYVASGSGTIRNFVTSGAGVEPGSLVLRNKDDGLSITGNIYVNKAGTISIPEDAVVPGQPYKISAPSSAVFPFAITSGWGADKPNSEIIKWFVAYPDTWLVSKDTESGEAALFQEIGRASCRERV